MSSASTWLSCRATSTSLTGSTSPTWRSSSAQWRSSATRRDSTTDRRDTERSCLHYFASSAPQYRDKRVCLSVSPTIAPGHVPAPSITSSLAFVEIYGNGSLWLSRFHYFARRGVHNITVCPSVCLSVCCVCVYVR